MINKALCEKWKFYVAVVERYNLELTKELTELHLSPEERAEALRAITNAPMFWAREYPAYPIPH